MQFDLELPQFQPADVLACVPGLNAVTFKQWIQRGAVTLRPAENAKRGRTPVYRGVDVIQVAAVHELTRQGMLASEATLAWQTVIQGRLIAWRTGLAVHDRPYGQSVFFWSHPETDELMMQHFSETTDTENPLDHPNAPEILILFRTDRFILRMIERMQRVKAGQLAVEAKPQRKPPSAFIGLAELEEQGRLETDDQGRRVLLGLTHAETIEYLRIVNLDLYERAGNPSLYATYEEKAAADDRSIELEDKHQAAMIRKDILAT